MKTVYYNSDGTECDMEDYIRDCPTRAQEELADIERRKEKAVNHPDYYKHGVELDYMGRAQLLTVVAKLIGVTDT